MYKRLDRANRIPKKVDYYRNESYIEWRKDDVGNMLGIGTNLG